MKNCPTCGQAKPKKMAEGGEPSESVESTPEDAATAEEPTPEKATEPTTPMSLAPMAVAAVPTTPETAPTPDVAALSDVAEQPSPQPVPDPTGNVKSDLDKKAADWAFDLENQHITPKTYANLFENKSLQGKIGTIFGLLLSGAGSGLAHQQNAVMSMMDKELANDFEAQKQSKTNAQNFLRITQAHELNDAQIERYAHENGLSDAQVANYKNDMQIKAATAAQNYAKLAQVHMTKEFYDKLPPGPIKDAALPLVEGMGKAAAVEIANRNAVTDANIKARKTLRGDEPPVIDSGINSQKLQQMQIEAQKGSAYGYVPKVGTAILPSDLGRVNDAATLVTQNRANYAMIVDAFKKLNSQFLAGTLNPESRKATLMNFETALAKQVGGEEAHRYVESVFPSAKDFGKSRESKFDEMTHHYKSIEAGASVLDEYPGIKTPFPNIPNPAAKPHKSQNERPAPSGLKEGMTGQDKNGKPWIVKGGKRVYQ